MKVEDISKYASLVNKKWTVKKVKALIASEVKSSYMQTIMFDRGWTFEMAEQAVINYLTCGKKVSIKDFMEEYV
nr:MAG TPA: hypothetical protein [Caudoviricetes sp.]